MSGDKRIVTPTHNPPVKKKAHDYYQLDHGDIEQNKRGEIISILSMDINETENKPSKSDSFENRQKATKPTIPKQNPSDYFENQKTLKQNMKYIKEQYDHDQGVSPCKIDIDEINVILNRQLKSRRSKHRALEYRERLDYDQPRSVRSKTHRVQKHQYIRNNHDIMSHNHKHKNSDSTDNSILKRSDGFGILYKRGEKLNKLLNHSESIGETP